MKTAFLALAILMLVLVAFPAVAIELLATIPDGWARHVAGVSLDFDGDGLDEIVAQRPGQWNPVLVYGIDGDILFSYVHPGADGTNFMGFADVDATPGPEGLFLWSMPHDSAGVSVQGFDLVSTTTGAVLKIFDRHPPGFSAHASFCDVIANGYSELLVTAQPTDYGPGGETQIWGTSTSAAAETAPTTRLKLTMRGTPSSEATASFVLQSTGTVHVAVYSIDGRAVRVLFSGEMQAGPHSIHWDGLDDFGNPATSGVYFAKVTTPAGESTAKLILAR